MNTDKTNENNKFNDQGLFENEFKDLQLLIDVFIIITFRLFYRYDYFNTYSSEV